VHIKDECTASLPPFEVPLRTRVETRLALLDNLRTVRKELQEGVGEVLATLDARTGADRE
jgi:hypothetical protein